MDIKKVSTLLAIDNYAVGVYVAMIRAAQQILQEAEDLHEVSCAEAADNVEAIIKNMPQLDLSVLVSGKLSWTTLRTYHTKVRAGSEPAVTAETFKILKANMKALYTDEELLQLLKAGVKRARKSSIDTRTALRMIPEGNTFKVRTREYPILKL